MEVPLKRLTQLAKDENGTIAGPAVRLLGQCKPSDRQAAIDALTPLLRSEKSPKGFVCASLARLGAEERATSVAATCLVEFEVTGFYADADPLAFDGEDRIGRSGPIGSLNLPWALSDVLDKYREAAVPALVRALASDEPRSRASAASVLGSLKDQRAIPALVKLLEDKSTYTKNLGERFRYEVEVRDVAIKAIADIGPPQSLLVKISRCLFDEKTRESACGALKAMGPKAKGALPTLWRLYSEASDREAETLARAILKIETDNPRRLKLMRQFLNPRSRSDLSWNAVDLILEAEDLAPQFIPDLKFMVEEHELLHSELRAAAAYALAVLEPENPKWRAWLEARSDQFRAGNQLHKLNKRMRRETK